MAAGGIKRLLPAMLVASTACASSGAGSTSVAAPPAVLTRPQPQHDAWVNVDELALRGDPRWLGEECHVLVLVIDTERSQLDHAPLAARSTQLRSAAANLGQVPLSSRVLQSLRDDYRDLLTDTADLTQAVSRADDAVAVHRQTTRFATLRGREQAVVDAINQHCGL